MDKDQLRLILEDQLERHASEQAIPGVVATVTVSGRGILSLTAGFEDLLRTRKINANGRFLIYSITKTFIAVAALRLAQKKVFALNDRVSTWLSEIEFAGSILVHQLLNHTSGLPDYGTLSSYQKAVEQESITPWSFSRFLKQTCASGLAFEPGQGWGYSNIGYMFLTKIIERATSKSLGQVLEAEVLTPLHLSATFLVSSPDDLKTLIPGYSKIKGKDGARDIREWYHPGWVAHGVLASTANDVNWFLEALFDGRLLDPHHLSEMLRMVPIPGHPPTVHAEYGLGIACETDPTFGSHYGHEGGGPGYHVIASHAPRLGGTTITVLCNRDDCNPRKISDSLLHTVFQASYQA